MFALVIYVSLTKTNSLPKMFIIWAIWTKSMSFIRYLIHFPLNPSLGVALGLFIPTTS